MKTFCIVLFAALVQLNHALPSNPMLSHPMNQPSLPIDPFIINGEDAKIGELPHQLMLQRSKGNLWVLRCGAILINSYQALTAAHCLENMAIENLRIVAGLIDIREFKDTQIVRVKKSVMHQKYNDGSATLTNDIGMITFAKPIHFTSNIKPIIWNYHKNLTFAKERCVLSGWGRDTSGYPNILQSLTINIISNEECINRLKPISAAKIYPGHICAYEAGYGGCNGDSGGPMTCQHEGHAMFAGISSFIISGPYGCNTFYPSGYARVSHFEKFIRDNLIQ